MNREEKRQLERLSKKAVNLKRKHFPTVFLAYVHPRWPDFVHESWAMGSVLPAIAASSGVCGMRPVGCASGPLLSRARNTLTREFLKTTDEYLLWTDTDIIFNFGHLKSLMELDLPAVGAIYFTITAEDEIVPVALEDEFDEEGKHTGHYRTVYNKKL